jgi:hypothetical protein
MRSKRCFKCDRRHKTASRVCENCARFRPAYIPVMPDNYLPFDDWIDQTSDLDNRDKDMLKSEFNNKFAIYLPCFDEYEKSLISIQED